ncbi:hypothetical protein BOX15_Mlig029939g1 [Macrostomum lignano]|uniref:Uncharacterized protein n=1 Tax=Macrostomum lignano TaxID=282301 RepID=A0A267ELU6_9PLAT|nr:hypothetical protein BOX15_Mlig029939g1 [Macrostomum lignano]
MLLSYYRIVFVIHVWVLHHQVKKSYCLPETVESALRAASKDRSTTLYLTYTSVLMMCGPLLALLMLTCFCWFREGELSATRQARGNVGAATAHFDVDWRERRLIRLQAVVGLENFHNAAYSARDPRVYLVGRHNADLLMHIQYRREMQSGDVELQ